MAGPSSYSRRWVGVACATAVVLGVALMMFYSTRLPRASRTTARSVANVMPRATPAPVGAASVWWAHPLVDPLCDGVYACGCARVAGLFVCACVYVFCLLV
jgi:hypothetical protein